MARRLHENVVKETVEKVPHAARHFDVQPQHGEIRQRI
jgi:hypothetical protein